MKLFKDKSKEIKELQPEEGLEPPVKLPEIKRTQAAPPMPAVSRSPPLFIKVDKYRNIVKNIRDLKTHLLNLRDALDVIEDMQKEFVNGVQIAHKTIDELNMIISSLDSFFMRPQGIEPHMEEEEMPEPAGPGRMTTGEAENYVKDVYSQLEKLRAQLKAIS
ncbi:MAG: hypothetical protein JSV39_00535 [Candidatus Aenigmatarchaeota archaeon]|nr:MAG: hypothetical protein JSV39_00535 [Candidatus Aenigmarchaeota archaeon]